MTERTRDLCGPMLRPCEGCGGTADYARAEKPGYVVARCMQCGRQTGPRASAESAAADWNRRITTGARVVTLAELRALDFGMGDDSDAVAVWIETREGELRAAVLTFGIDLGDPTVHEYGQAYERNWPSEEIATEGIGWRLWDKKPTQADRDAEPWGAPAWVEARQQRANAMIAEALDKAKRRTKAQEHPTDECIRNAIFCLQNPHDCLETEVEEARKMSLYALKAREPKMVTGVAETYKDILVGNCPSCDQTIASNVKKPTKYCRFCGQGVAFE